MIRNVLNNVHPAAATSANALALGVPAGACHRAAQSADPVAGTTTSFAAISVR
jgi:hypothetical protein